MTYTYAILHVSAETYAEIRDKLAKVGYSDQFHDQGSGEVIDMHGLALQVSTSREVEIVESDQTDNLFLTSGLFSEL